MCRARGAIPFEGWVDCPAQITFFFVEYIVIIPLTHTHSALQCRCLVTRSHADVYSLQATAIGQRVFDIVSTGRCGTMLVIKEHGPHCS